MKCSLWVAIESLIAIPEFTLGGPEPNPGGLTEKSRADLETFVNFINEHRSSMLSGKDLSNKVKKMVDDNISSPDVKIKQKYEWLKTYSGVE